LRRNDTAAVRQLLLQESTMSQDSSPHDWYGRTTLALNVIVLLVLALRWPGSLNAGSLPGLAAAILCITLFLIVSVLVSPLANYFKGKGSAILLGIDVLRVILAFFAFNEWPGSEDGAGMAFAFLALPIIWLLAVLSTRPLISGLLFRSFLGSTLFMYVGVLLLYLTDRRFEDILFFPTSLYHLVIQGRFSWFVEARWYDHVSHVAAWAWWSAVIYLVLRWKQRPNKPPQPRKHLTV
jgi:hypothetical protein